MSKDKIAEKDIYHIDPETGVPLDKPVRVHGSGGGGVSNPMESTLDANGQNINNVGALDAEDVAIKGNDFVATGDLALIGPSWGWGIKTFSTTSTTYVADHTQFSAETIWTAWQPQGATTAVLATFRVNTSQADVRVQNLIDAETVIEKLNVAASTTVSDSVTYTPTTTSGRVVCRYQVRNQNGNSTDLVVPMLDGGVQL